MTNLALVLVGVAIVGYFCVILFTDCFDYDPPWDDQWKL
jgi:hypothetical protein